jgi:predicted secreted protein
MRRHLALTAAIGLTCMASARADTILHLSDTETLTVHPDELVVRLRAEAAAPAAAAAQQAVNAAISAALERVRKVAGVTDSTEAYSAWQAPEPRRWQASQTLILRGSDGAALLTLTGDLQQSGLAISSLSWELSPAAFHREQDKALQQAIANLRGRAEQAAGLLGLRFVEFQRVNIAAPQPLPIGPRMMMATAMSAGPTPPSAEPEDVRVSATAEADVLLGPK